MNREDFIEELMKTCPYDKKETKSLVKLFFDTIIEKVLIEGESLSINNFGRFERVTRKPTKFVNNLSDEKEVIETKGYDTIRFIPSENRRL